MVFAATIGNDEGELETINIEAADIGYAYTKAIMYIVENYPDRDSVRVTDICETDVKALLR